MPETGKISASGFNIPRIRGHDIKATEVYIDDFLVQDPFTHLPIIDELDLKAFGKLEIYTGLSPAEIPSVQSAGVLAYKFKGQSPDSLVFEGGENFGRPFGDSTWIFPKYSRNNLTAEVYLRRFQSNGRYNYYNDEKTPFNTADDTVSSRENNDKRSYELIPHFKAIAAGFELEILGLANHSDAGISNFSESNSAREKSKYQFYGLKIKRPFAAGEWTFIPMYHLSQNFGANQTFDANREYLASHSESIFRSESTTHVFKAPLVSKTVEIFPQISFGDTKVSTDQDEQTVFKLRRKNQIATVGGRWNLLQYVFVEPKFQISKNSDVIDVLSDVTRSAEEKSVAGAKSASGKQLAVSVGVDQYSGFAQIGTADRLPSLLEEFGNGGTIRPADNLTSEKTLHREVGARVKQNYGLGRNFYSAHQFAFFVDDTIDKIVFMPSLGNSLKAGSLGSTQSRGFEILNEFTAGFFSLNASYARIIALNNSTSEDKKIPGIPEHTVVLEPVMRFYDCSIRWFSRYRSSIYRDAGNSIELPGAWIHDSSFDYKYQKDWKLNLGIQVLNVFDTISTPISSPDTAGNVGRTSFSDSASVPQPGRQWVVSLATEF